MGASPVEQVARSLRDLPTVAVNGTRLAYLETGKGDPVVFVHGTGGDLRTWENQLPRIGGSYRAIAYSRRYARPNADIPPGVDDQMLPHVDDLVAFLRKVGATPAHLVGHSWGAFVSLLTAVRHPEAVRTLVLEEPPVLSLFVGTPPRPAELLSLFLHRPRMALAILRFGARTMAPTQKAFRRGEDEEAIRRFAYGVLGKQDFLALTDEERQRVLENVGAMRAQLLGAGFPRLDPDDVRGVAAPTLLVTGDRSPSILRRLSDHLYELLPNAERVEIADASHRMHEEQPATVNKAILAHLRTRGRPVRLEGSREDDD